MRCPYCGGLNTDQARFCARCGRDVTTRPVSTQPPPHARQSYPPPQQQPYPPQPGQTPGQRPPFTPPRPPQPTPAGRAPVASRSRSTVSAPSQTPPAREKSQQRNNPVPDALSGGVTTPVAEPPVTFPPRTVQQLQALEAEAKEYTVLDESESYGRKKIVRIGYVSCAGWQQVATLYKALKAYRSDRLDTIIIYGISPEKADKYNYTNGMLQLDQKVRLGSQILNRYQIETENGFSSDAVRIVLTEE